MKKRVLTTLGVLFIALSMAGCGSIAGKSEASDKKIYSVKLDDTTKNYSFEELDYDFNMYIKMAKVIDRKLYVIFHKCFPEENYEYKYTLAMLDLDTRQYNEFPVESDLEVLCKDQNPDDGYTEEDVDLDNDLTIYGPMDEESGHDYLKLYWDNDELAGVSMSKCGTDKDGNIYALVTYSHEYRADGQICNDENQYQLLRWTQEGTALSADILSGDLTLKSELEDAGIDYDPYQYDENESAQVVSEDFPGSPLEHVARIDDKSFFAYYIDYDRHEDVTGIFTAME